MAEIQQERIRATIRFAELEIKTPYIKSFNVTRQRGQMVSSFSATVEILAADLAGQEVTPIDVAGQAITIHAGIEDDEKLIFTGDIKTVTINPSWDKPEYFLVNLSGQDVLGRLEGKRFSRRVKWTSAGMWVKITSIKTAKNRKRVRGFDKKYVRKIARITSLPDQGLAEHTSFTYARDMSQIDPYGKIKNPDKASEDQLEGEFTAEFV